MRQLSHPYLKIVDAGHHRRVRADRLLSLPLPSPGSSVFERHPHSRLHAALSTWFLIHEISSTKSAYYLTDYLSCVIVPVPSARLLYFCRRSGHHYSHHH